jgi:hypothetical protein
LVLAPQLAEEAFVGVGPQHVAHVLGAPTGQGALGQLGAQGAAEADDRPVAGEARALEARPQLAVVALGEGLGVADDLDLAVGDAGAVRPGEAEQRGQVAHPVHARDVPGDHAAHVAVGPLGEEQPLVVAGWGADLAQDPVVAVAQVGEGVELAAQVDLDDPAFGHQAVQRGEREPVGHVVGQVVHGVRRAVVDGGDLGGVAAAPGRVEPGLRGRQPVGDVPHAPGAVVGPVHVQVELEVGRGQASARDLAREQVAEHGLGVGRQVAPGEGPAGGLPAHELGFVGVDPLEPLGDGAGDPLDGLEPEVDLQLGDQGPGGLAGPLGLGERGRGRREQQEAAQRSTQRSRPTTIHDGPRKHASVQRLKSFILRHLTFRIRAIERY